MRQFAQEATHEDGNGAGTATPALQRHSAWECQSRTAGASMGKQHLLYRHLPSTEVVQSRPPLSVDGA